MMLVRNFLRCNPQGLLATSRSAVATSKAPQFTTSGSRDGKYPKSTIDAIKRFDSENLTLFGPIVKPGSKPKSSTTTTNDGTAAPVKKKRGRPKKVKPENEQSTADTTTNLGKENLQKTSTSSESSTDSKDSYKSISSEDSTNLKDSGTQTEHFLKDASTNTYNNADAAMGASVIYTDPEVKTDLSSLGGILSFPLFPPSMTEYYVNPPEIPSVHIPGHSERASFENPFYPSVGTILGATQSVQSKMALKRWKDNLVKELGEEGFKKHKQELFSRGTDFHSCIQSYLEGTPLSDIIVTEQNEGYWNSAQQVIKDVTDVQSVEKMVVHRDLCYRGQYDCIAEFRGQLAVIDWKTSKKAKSDIRFTYDNPLQVAAYVGAHNFSKDVDMIDKALIVVCYEDGQPADTHLLSRRMCVDYWAQWLQRLHQYWTEKLQS